MMEDICAGPGFPRSTLAVLDVHLTTVASLRCPSNDGEDNGQVPSTQ